jgi:MFS family permease
MASLASYAGLLRRNRNFRLLWMAQMVSEIGDWLYAVVLYDLLLQETGKASSVAFAVVLQVLPQVLAAPLAGVVNDRLSRRSVMIATDIGRFLVISAMLGVITIKAYWLIYPLLLCETIMWAFFEPGRSAILPNLVKDHGELTLANTIASVTWSFNLAVGAALGGGLTVLLGRDAVFGINAVSFLVSAWLLLRIDCVEPHLQTAARLRPADLVDYRPVAEGFRYIWHDSRLFALMLVKAGIGALGAHYVILTLYGERVFGQEGGAVVGMSLLLGSRGVGALIGPLAGTAWAKTSGPRRRAGIVIGFCCASAGYLALSAAPTLPLAMSCVVLAHAGLSMVWVLQTLLVQVHTDDKFRGRVFSADFAFLVLFLSLSTHLGGVAADQGVSVRTIAFVVGLIALVPAVAWSAFGLRLWRAGDVDARETLRQ